MFASYIIALASILVVIVNKLTTPPTPAIIQLRTTREDRKAA